LLIIETVWTILDHIELFWTVSEHYGAITAVSDEYDLFQMILGHSESLWTILDRLGLFGPHICLIPVVAIVMKKLIIGNNKTPTVTQVFVAIK
jgi:hypothetical protein